jgi:hypothetical protein
MVASSAVPSDAWLMISAGVGQRIVRCGILARLALAREVSGDDLR